MTSPALINSGYFITFEGIDGSGKGTQANKLFNELFWEGHDVALLREPGGTILGEALRNLILSHSKEERGDSPILRQISKILGKKEMFWPDGRVESHSFLDIDLEASVRTESLVLLASRAQLVSEKIGPWLSEGKIVICERYFDSSFAYQGYGKGENLEWLRRVNLATVGQIIPNLTLLLDITAEESKRRASHRGKRDRFEQLGVDFFERVRRGYLTLAQQEPGRWLVIDGTKPAEEITATIINRVMHEIFEAGIEPQENLWRRLGKEVNF